MNKESIGDITRLPPEQIAAQVLSESTLTTSRGRLSELMGTQHPTLKKAIEAIRELSPSFRTHDSQQWPLADLQALAIHLAYHQGIRAPFLISMLPEEFSPETFKEIDKTFLSRSQMAEGWQTLPVHTTKLILLVLSPEVIAERVPRKRMDNGYNASSLFPPQFYSLMEKEINEARENHTPPRRWIRRHQEALQKKAASCLPDFPHQFRQWLEKNIVEWQEPPRPPWQPDDDKVRKSIMETADAIAEIKARTPDANELDQDQDNDDLRLIYLPPLSDVRLTKEEEGILSRAISLMLQAKKAQPSPENQPLHNETIEIGREAKETMVETNLKFVFFVIRNRFSGWIESPLYNDLFQEGTIGLMKATEKFDPQRGGRFTSYAFYWIRQAVRRSIINYSKMIRQPVHAYEGLVKARQAIAQLEQQQGGVPPTEEQISQEAGMSTSRLSEILNLPTTVSLDSPSPHSDSTDFPLWEEHFLPPGSPIKGRDPEIFDQERIAAVMKQAGLSEREQDILWLRFFKDETLEKIGERLGLSREGVRQIEKRALGKLREVFRKSPFL